MVAVWAWPGSGSLRMATAMDADSGSTGSQTQDSSSAIDVVAEALLLAGLGHAALSLLPDDPNGGARSMFLRAKALLASGDPRSATPVFEAVVRRRPADVAAWNNLGVCLQATGRLSEAEAALRAGLHVDPGAAALHYNLANLVPFDEGDGRIAEIETLLAAASEPTDRIHLHYALGRGLHQCGRPGPAAAHFTSGSELKRRSIGYDEAATLSLFDAAARTSAAPPASAGGVSGPRPIFVVGMPRSGTTLVEQVLAAHPGVAARGEQPDVERAMRDALGEDLDVAGAVARAPGLSAAERSEIGRCYAERMARLHPGAEAVTNKLTTNALLCGLIIPAIPGARIVHVSRDAFDTCFSCYGSLFAGDTQPFSYQPHELARYCRSYDALMRHVAETIGPAQALSLRYEDLVRDFRNQAERLLGHCGLGWSDACLAFHDAPNAVMTASAVQVRRPLYASSIGQAAPYRAIMRDLVSALES